jgi:NADH:ubiquinone oxidoreductase subunit E
MRAARPALASARPPSVTLARRRTRRPRATQTRADADTDRCALVCTSKECKRKGALRVYERLKVAAETRGDVRAGTTRCQSECADGPNVKLLPEGVVLNGVRSDEDVDAALARAAEYARAA